MFRKLSVVLVVVLGSLSLAVHSYPASQAKRLDNPEERGPFFEGDIILPPNTKGGVIGEIFRWPNATIVYAVDQNFTQAEKAVIQAAMDEISGQTCVRFKHLESELAYVYIDRGGPNSGGCWSLLGRLGIVQLLNLEADGGCINKGTIVHELLHTVGFYHEQSRTDRDGYITINWSNIRPGEEGQFAKLASHLYNISYDYGSIMHYSRYAFAVDPTIPTIVTPDPDTVIGQRNALSPSDIEAVNAMYCPNL